MQSGLAGKQFARAGLVAGLLIATVCAHSKAADLPVTGNLLGSVVDGAGNPQIGASVLLFNRYERAIGRTLTAQDGRFAFAGLPLDSYSVRVSLSSFLPAFKDRIAVKAGLDSILQIHLATLFSNVEVSYSVPAAGMTDDWKWVLRASPSTRPIVRYLPEEVSTSAALHPRVFSGTHAMLSLSAGDASADSETMHSDMGTGFALSTNLLGKNQLQFAGSYGQRSMLDAGADIGLCAIYSRNVDGTFSRAPEVTLTISQLSRFSPQFAGSGALASQLGNQFGGQFGNPGAAMRTMSLSIYQVTDPLDGVHVEYGITGESVDYIQHASRVSPFARATVALGKANQIIAAYSDGGRPDELTAHQRYESAEADGPGDDLASAVGSLTRLPQISNSKGQLELQRTQNYELGLNRKTGSTTFAVSGFYERVSNGRLNLAGDLSSLDPTDLLLDSVSKTSTYNIGRYTRTGFLTSVDQQVSDSLDFTMAYGRLGGFTPLSSGLGNEMAASGGAGQQSLEAGNHNVASVNIKARAPGLGTRFVAGYGWMDSRSVLPQHVFTTQTGFVSPGLNFGVKQPLPSLFGLPGRLEVTADLRNLLAQGYIPVGSGDGRTLLIVQAPRAIRGGLSFTF